MSKKKAVATPPRKRAPLGAEWIVWAMPGKPSLPLPSTTRGRLPGEKKLLEWLQAIRQLCLAKGDFLTAIAAVRWLDLDVKDFDRALALFERHDRQAKLDYWEDPKPESP